MSILVIEVLHEGLIFGADRNITTEYGDGTTTQERQSSKVLKWPHNKCLFGFVGAAQMGNLPMIDWLGTIKDDFRDMDSVKAIAHELHKKVQMQRNKDDAHKSPEALIIHIGGFEKKDVLWVPTVWSIRNTHRIGRFDYLDIRHEFCCTEVFWTNDLIKDVDASEIRRFLKVLAKQFKPFWFHQGLDLFTFNVLERAIKSAFRLLCEQHPNHDIPTTLHQWEKHVRMQVLMYGAYFEAFRSKGEQFVGGGSDIVSTLWPT
ncbi:MAG: hypothetical protein A2Z25_05755 [Planctomycetes bacterium RBG_16_55_9]|nr:MAG: hypothetical protein A2Z25_05755 [Planctomycetes bacterium RBG_16_55_9]